MKELILNFPAAPEDFPCEVQLAGISWCDGSYRIERKKGSFFVFEYIVKGEGYLDTPKGNFRPAAGDLYLAHANQPHNYGSSRENPWEKIWFNVNGPLIHQLIDCYRLNDTWYVSQCAAEDIFRSGLEKLRSQPRKAHETIAVTIHEIIQMIAGQRHRRREHEKNKSREGRKLKELLDCHVLDNPSIGDMARHISRSESQTIRIFRRDWKTTPYRYLLDKRIELAKLYLKSSSKSIKEIAGELRFADAFYFSDIFKRKVGKSPTQYREVE